jgi:hypothetical protein
MLFAGVGCGRDIEAPALWGTARLRAHECAIDEATSFHEVFPMSMKLALQWIFTISILGIAFSGTLTYREVFAGTAAACPSPGAPGTILGYPACVYGLLMYLVIAAVSGNALRNGRRHITPAASY